MTSAAIAEKSVVPAGTISVFFTLMALAVSAVASSGPDVAANGSLPWITTAVFGSSFEVATVLTTCGSTYSSVRAGRKMKLPISVMPGCEFEMPITGMRAAWANGSTSSATDESVGPMIVDTPSRKNTPYAAAAPAVVLRSSIVLTLTFTPEIAPPLISLAAMSMPLRELMPYAAASPVSDSAAPTLTVIGAADAVGIAIAKATTAIRMAERRES